MVMIAFQKKFQHKFQDTPIILRSFRSRALFFIKLSCVFFFLFLFLFFFLYNNYLRAVEHST